MPLSDTAIRNAKPSEKPRKLADGGGLYIEISPSGGGYGDTNIALKVKKSGFPLGYILMLG